PTIGARRPPAARLRSWTGSATPTGTGWPRSTSCCSTICGPRASSASTRRGAGASSHLGHDLDGEQFRAFWGMVVAARGVAQAAIHPGQRVLLGPAGVLTAGGQPSGRHAGHDERRSPVGVHRHAEHLAGAERDADVPFGREVQAVLAPRARVAQYPHRPEVDDLAAALVGDRAQVHVVRGDPPAQHPDHRKGERVEAGEDQHAAARRPQAGHARVELGRQRVHLGAAQEVVSASGDTDHVGGHGDRRLDLLGDYVPHQIAADREVRVTEAGNLGGQCHGDAVGPADRLSVRAEVVEPFGKAVTEGYERGDVVLRHTPMMPKPRRDTGSMRTTLAGVAALVIGATLTAAGCGGSAGGSTGPTPTAKTIGPSSTAAGHPVAAWPVYGGDNSHTDVASAALAGQPRIAWRTTLDGAVYGQPLLVGNLVIVATENDSLYGLEGASGRVVW